MMGRRDVWRAAMGLGLAAALGACGGDVGPPQNDLVGVWAMEDPQIAVDGAQAVQLSDVRVTYRGDGTSDYAARLQAPGEDGTPIALLLDGDVRWTLEETVLTRTLEQMQVSAAEPSAANDQIAALYAQGLNSQPPARFIVEALDDAQLVLLDPETGDTLRFTRTGEGR